MKVIKTVNVANPNSPDAFFNVSGLFISTPIILKMIEITKDKFDYSIPIKRIHGCPDCLWNGGRIVKKNYGFKKSIEEIKKEFLALSKYNIKPYLTFSNHLLREEDLHDIESNKYLSVVNEFDGGVILSSELLKSYIEEKYPHMSLHLSVIKSSMIPKEYRLKHYLKNEGRYKLQVIHPDDNFDLRILGKLNPQKTEIILNERCVYGCKKRAEHYTHIIASYSNKEGKFISPTECEAIPKLYTTFTKNRNISLTPLEVRKIYELGFRNFKIQGREANLYLFFYDIIRYTLDDFAGPLVFSLLVPLCPFGRRA